METIVDQSLKFVLKVATFGLDASSIGCFKKRKASDGVNSTITGVGGPIYCYSRHCSGSVSWRHAVRKQRNLHLKHGKQINRGV